MPSDGGSESGRDGSSDGRGGRESSRGDGGNSGRSYSAFSRDAISASAEASARALNDSVRSGGYARDRAADAKAKAAAERAQFTDALRLASTVGFGSIASPFGAVGFAQTAARMNARAREFGLETGPAKSASTDGYGGNNRSSQSLFSRGSSPRPPGGAPFLPTQNQGNKTAPVPIRTVGGTVPDGASAQSAVVKATKPEINPAVSEAKPALRGVDILGIAATIGAILYLGS